MTLKTLYIRLIIALLAAVLFIPFLGGVHLFDWDEINFAEIAREMIATNNYLTVQIDFEPFWEKPPLFIWMQVVSMKLFGINEFAARFPNALCGIATLLVLFEIGNRLFSQKFGLLWVVTYAGAILPFFYFKSGIIDPWFNLFIFIGIYFFVRYSLASIYSQRLKHLILSATFIGLAVLTKGPVALVVFGLSFVAVALSFMFFPAKAMFENVEAKNFLVKRLRPLLTLSFTDIIVYAIILTLVGGFWFILQILNGNYKIIQDFIVYQIRLFSTQDAGHGGFLLYHFVVLLVGVFPTSIFALQAFRRSQSDTPEHYYFKRWMIIVLWIVLILFTIVKTKIIHYSSLCYFPLSFLAAYSISQVADHNRQWRLWSKILLTTVCFLLAVVVIALPFVNKYKDVIIESGIIKDEFAVENLKAQVYWSGFEWLIGLGFFIGILFFVFLSKSKNYLRNVLGIYTVTILFTITALLILTPKIEQYSQNAAIEFYKQKSNENCYVQTLGFKSYAHLFYAARTEPTDTACCQYEWLMNGNADKPVYFVAKITKLSEVQTIHTNLQLLYTKNGFAFFQRTE